MTFVIITSGDYEFKYLMEKWKKISARELILQQYKGISRHNYIKKGMGEAVNTDYFFKGGVHAVCF